MRSTQIKIGSLQAVCGLYWDVLLGSLETDDEIKAFVQQHVFDYNTHYGLTYHDELDDTTIAVPHLKFKPKSKSYSAALLYSSVIDEPQAYIDKLNEFDYWLVISHPGSAPRIDYVGSLEDIEQQCHQFEQSRFQTSSAYSNDPSTWTLKISDAASHIKDTDWLSGFKVVDQTWNLQDQSIDATHLPQLKTLKLEKAKIIFFLVIILLILAIVFAGIFSWQKYQEHLALKRAQEAMEKNGYSAEELKTLEQAKIIEAVQASLKADTGIMVTDELMDECNALRSKLYPSLGGWTVTEIKCTASTATVNWKRSTALAGTHQRLQQSLDNVGHFGSIKWTKDKASSTHVYAHTLKTVEPKTKKENLQQWDTVFLPGISSLERTALAYPTLTFEVNPPEPVIISYKPPSNIASDIRTQKEDIKTVPPEQSYRRANLVIKGTSILYANLPALLWWPDLKTTSLTIKPGSNITQDRWELRGTYVVQ